MTNRIEKKVEGLRDFFVSKIEILNSTIDQDKRLTGREVRFLAECCYFHYYGGDLGKWNSFSEYLVMIKFFPRKIDCSGYKKRLRDKSWIKGNVILPPFLSFREGEDPSDLEVILKYNDDHEESGEDVRRFFGRTGTRTSVLDSR